MRSSLRDLPIFYLGLSTEELTQLLENMHYGFDQTSQQETEIFSKLISSVTEQLHLFTNQQIPDGVRTNLGKFKQSLQSLQSQPN